MTTLELIAFFPGQSHLFIAGDRYATPTLEYLQGPFYTSYRAWLYSLSLDTWTNPWECRDFARAYATWAQVCNAKTPIEPIGTSALAVGEQWFEVDAEHYNYPRGGHAICPVVTENGVQYIDPQTNLLWQMSPSELLSVRFLRF